MLVLFSACGQSKVQEKFDTITTYSYTNSYGKDGRLAEVLIKQQSQFLENGAYISGRAVEITQRYNYPDNDTYMITETDDLSPNEISTVIKGKTFEKYYTLKNNDTIKFQYAYLYGCNTIEATGGKRKLIHFPDSQLLMKRKT